MTAVNRNQFTLHEATNTLVSEASDLRFGVGQWPFFLEMATDDGVVKYARDWPKYCDRELMYYTYVAEDEKFSTVKIFND